MNRDTMTSRAGLEIEFHINIYLMMEENRKEKER
jgi:hypothetical protein